MHTLVRWIVLGGNEIVVLSAESLKRGDIIGDIIGGIIGNIILVGDIKSDIIGDIKGDVIGDIIGYINDDIIGYCRTL